MLSRDIKKLLTKKPTFASLLDEATHPYGNSRKHKAAINKEETPAVAEAEPTKGLPFGKSRKHKKALGKSQELPPENEPAPETEVDPNSEVATIVDEPLDAPAAQTPETEADEVDPEAEAADAEVEAEDAATAEEDATAKIEDEVEEQEVKEEEHDTARVMSIDRRHLNRDLAELCATETDVFPINSIREILSRCNLKIVDDEGNDIEVVLTGADGNTDLQLAYNNGQRISNSALVLYWHRIDNKFMYDINAYLS